LRYGKVEACGSGKVRVPIPREELVGPAAALSKAVKERHATGGRGPSQEKELSFGLSVTANLPGTTSWGRLRGGEKPSPEPTRINLTERC